MDKLLKEVPEFNIKLDPVGIMRNMKDDPYEIMKRYANRIAHFHAKDIFRYGDDGWEIRTYRRHGPAEVERDAGYAVECGL